MCTTATLKHAAEMTLSLRLLHNNVPVVHATATFNVAKSTTELKKIWQKFIFLCFQSMAYFFIAISWQLLSCFRTAEAYLNGTFRENGIFNDVIITFAILSDK